MPRCLYLTLFDNGGGVRYWRDLVNSTSGSKWEIFCTPITSEIGVGFDSSNSTYIEKIDWKSKYRTTLNFAAYFLRCKPEYIYLNATLAEVLIFPLIFVIRVFRLKTKVICIYHNVDLYPGRIKNHLNRLLLSFFGFFHYKNIFVSDAVGRYWLCKGRVLKKPVTIKTRQICFRETRRVGFLGRLSEEKGPELFCAAASDIAKVIKITIHAAGVGPLLPELSMKYKNIDFLGWVDQPLAFLRDIDLLLVTSRTEGYPLNILEALSAGTPVISFNVGGVSEIFNSLKFGSKWLVPEGDLTRLIDTTQEFLQQYEKNYEEYFRPSKISSTSISNNTLLHYLEL